MLQALAISAMLLRAGSEPVEPRVVRAVLTGTIGAGGSCCSSRLGRGPNNGGALVSVGVSVLRAGALSPGVTADLLVASPISGDGLAAGALFAAVLRIGGTWFVEPGFGIGYGWATRRFPDGERVTGGAWGPAATARLGVHVTPSIAVVARAGLAFSDPGLQMVGAGIESAF